jgi:O-antigen/teichoic acid export membrane protein
VALARTLSPDDYGRYSFVVAYLTLFQVLADFGLEPILLRRLAQEPERRGRWMANALGLRIALAVASAALAVALTPVAAPGRPDLRPLVAIGAAGLLFVSQPGFRALLRSELRLDDVLRVALATNVLLLGAAFAAVWTGGGLLAVFVAISVSHLAGFGLAAFVARDAFRFRVALDPPVWRSLLAEAWPVGANVFAVMVGLRAATLFLMTYRGPVDVGYLASAMRLAEALNLVADGLMLTAFPLLARLALEDGERLRDLARACAKALAAALLVVVLILSELAPDVLALLFGAEFRAAGPALVLLSWFALLAALGTLYANLLVAVGRQRVLFVLNAVSALFQVGLQLVLVSRFGLVGAASGIVVASALNHAVLWLLPGTRTWIRPCVHAVLPLLGLAVLLLGIAAASPATPMVEAVALVVAFVLLAAWVTGGRAELERLRRALAAGV